MTEVALETLRIVRRFNAAPERVFDAWLDPKLAGRWLFTTPESESHTIELDVRVGGRWKVVDRRDGVDYTAIGEYRLIDRPRRLVFTFGMPQFSPEFAEVTVEFAPDAGGCLMTLSQDRVAAEAIGPLTAGWNAMFDALAGVVGQSG